MRTEVIKADTVDGAVERILQELKEEDEATDTTSSGRHNVIYFDGWDGLGASAVLRDVGRRLTQKEPGPGLAEAGPKFSQVVHIDCSKWESRRSMQRALAEQLQLPAPVLEIFDAQDEEDDYKGEGTGSRAEIPKVSREIYEHIQKQPGRRFLVIFNNGSCEEVDLESFGFPLSGYSRNKALWSFQGGFRLYPRTKVDRALESTRKTDVVLAADSSDLDEDKLSKILRHEAEEAARGMTNDIGGIDWTAAATDCFMYMMRLCGMGGHLIDYDLATHGCNYWICDGIIQQPRPHVGADDDGADTLWLSCDALKHEMQMDAGYHQSPHLPSPLARRLHERIPYWTSPRYGSTLIPTDRNGRIPQGMFQRYDKLCVLKLSACAFSFASPPFLCCHSLRFLWLNHCRDESSSTVDGVAGNEEDVRRCLQRLWVLDVRYSSSKLLWSKMMGFMTQLRELNVTGQEDFDVDNLQAPRLHNIRKLQVTKSSYHARPRRYSTDEVFFSGKDKMEHLDLSGNSGYENLYVTSSCSCLKNVTIDGAISLRVVSLKGCAKLENLHLSGSFPDLYSLDLSGTAVKTLDLSAVTAPKLNQLFLIDCEELCAILWPPQDKMNRYLGKLHIGTATKDLTAIERTPRIEFSWYIYAKDARFLDRSLAPVKDYFGPHYAYVEISTTTTTLPSSSIARLLLHEDAAGGRTKSSNGQQEQGNPQQPKGNATYADVAAMHQQAVMRINTPSMPSLPLKEDCFMRIQDQMTKTNLQTVGSMRIDVPGFVCDSAKILDVHDSLFITSILATPSGSSWNRLECCQVEQCPQLECVFSPELGARPERSSNRLDIFKKLKTIWASRLRNARYILECTGPGGPRCGAFADLTLLQLHYCPRLVYAIPLQRKTMSMKNLETIEIMWCGDLRVAFHLYDETSDHERDKSAADFPNLKRIHLHELPRLRSIFDIHWDSLAPKIETVRIRGCWSLRALPPFIYKRDTVECDCEKEWWDTMEERYRRVLVYHFKKVHPRYQMTIRAHQYRLIHPRHYKKTMLRGSVLR